MIYQYRCDKGHEFDRVLPVAEYNAPQICDCGAHSVKIIVPVRGYVEQFEAFKDNSGQVITSKHGWKEHLKRTDSVELGRSDFQSMHRNKQEKFKNIGKDKYRKERIAAEFEKRRMS